LPTVTLHNHYHIFLLHYLLLLGTLISCSCYVIFKFLLHYLSYLLLCLPDMFYCDSSCSATDIALLPSRRLHAASHSSLAPLWPRADKYLTSTAASALVKLSIDSEEAVPLTADHRLSGPGILRYIFYVLIPWGIINLFREVFFIYSVRYYSVR